MGLDEAKGLLELFYEVKCQLRPNLYKDEIKTFKSIQIWRKLKIISIEKNEFNGYLHQHNSEFIE